MLAEGLSGTVFPRTFATQITIMGKKKKVSKKKVVSKPKSRSVSHEIVVKVQSMPTLPIVPTAAELAEPVTEGGKYMIPKTWVSEKQVLQLLQKTPDKYKYSRPAKGGGKWAFVTGSYVTKVLNWVFGWAWDFEIASHGKEGDMVWVLGKLTVKDDKGHTITKTQFGRADVKFKRGTKEMLDYGNDLKSATTDALKKCASLLGIASDIYGKTEFKQETGQDVSEEPRQLQAPTKAYETFKGQTEKIIPVNDGGPAPIKPGQIAGPDGHPVWVCKNDEAIITEQEANFSLRVYGKRLCRACQASAKSKK